MSGLSVKNRHGVYVDREHLSLIELRTRIPLAEVRVADTADGFRATTCFAFTTGNWWGSSSPITDHDQPFARRDDAIAHAAARLSERLSTAPAHAVEPTMEAQRKRIINWLSGLLKSEPQQMDLFA